MTTTFAVQVALLLLLTATVTTSLTEGNNLNADASDLGEDRWWGLYSPDDRDLASLETWQAAGVKRYLGAAMRLRGKKNMGSAMRLRGKKNMGSAMKWRGKKNLGSAMRLRYRRHVGMPWRYNQGAARSQSKRNPEPESNYWTDNDEENSLTEQQVKRHLGAAMRLGGSHSHRSYYYRHPWNSSTRKRYLGSAMRFRSLAAAGNPRMFHLGWKRHSADDDGGDGGRRSDNWGQEY